MKAACGSLSFIDRLLSQSGHGSFHICTFGRETKIVYANIIMLLKYLRGIVEERNVLMAYILNLK